MAQIDFITMQTVNIYFEIEKILICSIPLLIKQIHDKQISNDLNLIQIFIYLNQGSWDGDGDPWTEADAGR